MRKFTGVILIIAAIMLLTACAPGEAILTGDNDHQKAQGFIETVFKAIQDKDAEKLKALFSQSILSQLPSYDESVQELFEYFNGSVDSFDDGAGPFVETTKEDNFVLQRMESSFVVKTDACEYRFAMQYVTQGDAKDMGISSLYVIKTMDDENLDYVYWGDGSFTPGIHVAVPNMI